MTLKKFKHLFNFTLSESEKKVQIEEKGYIGNITHLEVPSHVEGYQVYLPDDCTYLFNGPSKLVSIDLSMVKDTSNVRFMYDMFKNCTALRTINLANFCTDNVETMRGAFKLCYSLTSLDLSSFNTAKVSNMKSMFEGCSALKELNISSFNASAVEQMSNMFKNCPAGEDYKNDPRFTKAF